MRISDWSSDVCSSDLELTGLIDPANTGSSIWADTAYPSQKNERAILRAGRVSKIHFRRSPGKPLPAQRQRAKAKIGLANLAFNFKRFLYWESRMAAT